MLKVLTEPRDLAKLSLLRPAYVGRRDRDEQERLRLDKERQLLVTVLLAQLCAQQDLTPRAFCEQVLRLHERGILDSIQFLFDYGFVAPPDLLHLGRASDADAVRASLDRQASSMGVRAGELARPILLASRYARDYEELGLVARGAFGDVYRARHRLDGNEYAIKKVTFKGGLQSPRAQLSLREVTNLSRLDHPNVVRYHTAWLESNWGAQRAAVDSLHGGPALLGAPSAAAAPAEPERMRDAPLAEESATWVEEVSEWSDREDEEAESFHNGGGGGGAGSGRRGSSAGSLFYSGYGDDEDAVAFVRSADGPQDSAGSTAQQNDDEGLLSDKGNHNVTLLIAMQLCRGATLQEWLRRRNRNVSTRRATSADLGAAKAAAEQEAAAAAAAAAASLNGLSDIGGPSGAPLTRQRSWSAGSDATPVPLGAPEKDVDMREVLELFRQLMQGLTHVHGKQLMHRDLKPENMFLVEDGDERIVKIGDFGLSTAHATPAAATDTHSEMGEALEAAAAAHDAAFVRRTVGVGTASYAAPENLSGLDYSQSADIFSCGLILLELACPFHTAHERAAAFGALRRSPGSVPASLQRKHPHVAALILQLTAADPAKRPSAGDVLEVLRAPTPEEEALRLQIAEKDAVIERLRQRLEELQLGAKEAVAGC